MRMGLSGGLQLVSELCDRMAGLVGTGGRHRGSGEVGRHPRPGARPGAAGQRLSSRQMHLSHCQM
jgi:hypothetical protein